MVTVTSDCFSKQNFLLGTLDVLGAGRDPLCYGGSRKGSASQSIYRDAPV